MPPQDPTTPQDPNATPPANDGGTSINVSTPGVDAPAATPPADTVASISPDVSTPASDPTPTPTPETPAADPAPPAPPADPVAPPADPTAPAAASVPGPGQESSMPLHPMEGKKSGKKGLMMALGVGALIIVVLLAVVFFLGR